MKASVHPDGQFIRIGLAIDAIGPKRNIIDIIETLFGGWDNRAKPRHDLSNAGKVPVRLDIAPS
jgi:hypothetical protein